MGTVEVDGVVFDYTQNPDGTIVSAQFNGALTITVPNIDAFEEAARTGILLFNSNPESGVTVNVMPPQVVSSAETWKSDFWLRASETEAVTLEQMLAAAPARMRGVFNGVQSLQHSSPLFASLYADISAALGDEVAARLLAPSGDV
jgi:hypothetical protein